jgi:hypothetical protein
LFYPPAQLRRSRLRPATPRRVRHVL